jgi:Icc-related predicted phosphoesterase
MIEKVAGWSASSEFNLMIHGHWHEWHIGNWLGRTVVANGCMCGPDDLARRIGHEDAARQAYIEVVRGQPISRFGHIEW